MPRPSFLIRSLGRTELKIVHALAHNIWPHAFKDILSRVQIDYMLELMYSVDSLEGQWEDGCVFYLLESDGNASGYLAIQHQKEGSGATKIHKIYLLPEMQGKGAGRLLMEKAVLEAKKKGSTTITLNVNRYNKAIEFYEHYGFKKKYTEDIDIGEGYLMEDWVMEKDFTF